MSLNSNLLCTGQAWWEHVSAYPSETVLFTALPTLRISSRVPRTVAHQSNAKTTKSTAQRSHLFFFIFTSPYDRQPDRKTASPSRSDWLSRHDGHIQASAYQSILCTGLVHVVRPALSFRRTRPRFSEPG